MYNMTRNPANANFDIYVDGTTNLTTTLMAWGFAAKGHYYQLSDEAASSAPTLVDQEG